MHKICYFCEVQIEAVYDMGGGWSCGGNECVEDHEEHQ